MTETVISVDAEKVADVFLNEYLRLSITALRNFCGEFAVAIWDSRSSCLYLAVDSLGLKQLYTAQLGDAIVFCDDLRTLLLHVKRPLQINEGLLGEYLADNLINRDQTFYEGVNRVPSGCFVSISAKRIGTHSYYSVPSALFGRLRQTNENDLVQQFKSHLKRALDFSLSGSQLGQLGAELSGGLDSTSLVCSLVQESPYASPVVLSGVFQREALSQLDERRFISQTSRICSLDVNHVCVDEQLPLEDLRIYEEIIHLGPCLDINWFAITSIYNKAMQLGLTHLLTGIGGDLLTGSRLAYLDLLRSGNVRTCLEYMRLDRAPLRGLIFWYLLLPTCPVWLQKAFLWFLDEREATSIPWPSWLRRDFIHRSELSHRLHTAKRIDGVPYISTEQEISLGLTSSLEFSLSACREAARRRNVILRYPFLDARFVEFIMALPPEYRFRAGVEKYILREAVRGVVPEIIRLREKKTFFNTLAATGLRQNLEIVKEFLLAGHLVERGIIDKNRTADCLKSLSARSDRYLIDIWLMLSAELWLQWVHRPNSEWWHSN